MISMKSAIAAWAAVSAAGLFLAASGAREIPDYSKIERKDIPKPYTWSIEDVYPSVEAWQTDRELFREMVKRIPETGRDWTATPAKMLAMWRLHDALYQKIFRLYSFAMHQNNTDLADDRFVSMLGEARSLLAELSAGVSFMKEDIRKLGLSRLNEMVESEPLLKPYKFPMTEIARLGEHLLPREQQEMIRGSEAFSDAFRLAAGVLNNLEMPRPEVTLADGGKIRLDYSGYQKFRDSDNPADRENVVRTFWENRNGFLRTFAALLDGEIKKQVFLARTQGYRDCLAAALDEDAIDPAVFHTMIEQVRGNLGPFFRYLKLKKRLLRAGTLRYSELHRSPFPAVDRLYGYDEARRIIEGALRPLGTEYSAMIREAFRERWVDVYPNKNKQPSAYSANLYGVHPFVKLNYDGRLPMINNLIHELGHAAFGEFSARFQPFATSDPVTFLDEIASTLNENLLLHYLLKSETDRRFKIHLIDGFLKRPVRIALYGQAQLSEFELALHREVEQGRTLTADWLNGKYLELLRYYNGEEDGIVAIDDFSRGEWSWIPQLYRGYYVYTYATGMVSSMSIASAILKGDSGARRRYLDLLKSGGSDHPLALLKKAGIDLSDPAVYRMAFASVDELVSEMERLAAELEPESPRDR